MAVNKRARNPKRSRRRNDPPGISRVTFGLQSLLIFLGLAVLIQPSHGPVLSQNKAVRTVAKQQLLAAYGQLPLSFQACFEVNCGQAAPHAKFLSRGRGYTLFLAPSETVLALRKPASGEDKHATDAAPTAVNSVGAPATEHTVIRMQLVGANPEAQVTGLDKLPGHSNYFRGNDAQKWRTNVPNYAKVKYEDVYPGVDVVYYGNQRQLEYDFVVAPGTDPGAIRLHFQGADPLTLDTQGNLSPAHHRGRGSATRPGYLSGDRG